MPQIRTDSPCTLAPGSFKMEHGWDRLLGIGYGLISFETFITSKGGNHSANCMSIGAL